MDGKLGARRVGWSRRTWAGSVAGRAVPASAISGRGWQGRVRRGRWGLLYYRSGVVEYAAEVVPGGRRAAFQRRGTGFSHGSVLHLRLRKTLDFSVVFLHIASHERHSGHAPDDAGSGAGRAVPTSRRGTKEGGGTVCSPGGVGRRGMYLEGRNRSLQWMGEGGRMEGKQRNCIQELP